MVPKNKYKNIKVTYLLIYLLTLCSGVLLGKLTVSQLVKKFSTFYGTPGFITAVTLAPHLSLSWASSIQSIPPNHTSWRSILIIYSYLSLGIPSDLFLSGFPTKTLYTPLPSLIRATYPAHLIILYFTTRNILGEDYRSLSSSLCSFLHSTVNSSHLGPNILLNTRINYIKVDLHKHLWIWLYLWPKHVVSITSNDVQSNTTSLTNIFIDLGLHVSIH